MEDCARQLPGERANSRRIELRHASQQIDICFRDEIFFFYVETGEQLVGDGLPFRFGLLRTEYHFEFQKISQACDVVEMYAGLPNHVERSIFPDLAYSAHSLVEYFEENRGIRGSRDQIMGTASIGDIRSLVSNQLSTIRAQNSKLETRFIAAKKVILLANQLGSSITQSSSDYFDALTIPQNRFDLNV